MAVQVRTGKVCRGLIRSGWVGCGRAVMDGTGKEG